MSVPAKNGRAVGVPPLTALAVFALMAGLCEMIVLGVVMGETLPLQLGFGVVAAIITGLLGMLIVPCVLYNNAYMAVFIGVLVAVLSQITLCAIFWWWAAIDTSLVYVLAYGYLFGVIPQIILGLLAGYICYRKGVPSD